MMPSNMNALKDIMQSKEEAEKTSIELAERIKCFQEIFEQEKPETMEENCSVMNTPAGVEMVDYFRKAIQAQRDLGIKLRKFCSEELISHLDNEKTAFLLYEGVINFLSEKHRKVFDPEAVIQAFAVHIAAREETIFDCFVEWAQKQKG